MLRRFGTALTMPYCRKLAGSDLWELRARQGSDIVRLFYFPVDGRMFIVVSGYRKKSDRIDPRQIRQALRLKDQFESEERR